MKNRDYRRAGCASLTALWLLGALAPASPPQAYQATAVVVADAWVRETSRTRTTSSGYFTIENNSGRAVTLTAVSVAEVDHATLHATVDQNGTASMKPLKTVTIPAHGSVTFAPGGSHVMLAGVRSPFTSGDRVRMTLEFDGAPAQTVRALVRPLAASAIR